MNAYLKDDLWRRNATHANAMAARLRDGITPLKSFEFPYSNDGNMLFTKIPKTLHKSLNDEGFLFYGGRWEQDVVRLVTAFNTCLDDVDAFIEASRRLEPVAAQF